MPYCESYQGLAAELYDLLYAQEGNQDFEYYRRYLREAGGLALEAACGTGRLLLPYLKEGLSVEGADISRDMLALCRKKATAMGLSPVLYQQPMEEMELPHTYNSIYVPYSSFMNIADYCDAARALNRIYDHLTPGGQLLLSLFVPRQDAPENVWQLRHSMSRAEDGADILSHRALRRDPVEQTLTSWFRYEVFAPGRPVETYLQTTVIRWYGQYEIRLLLEKVGFREIAIHGDFTDVPYGPSHQTMAIRAVK